MSLGLSLGAFAEGFAGARAAKMDREAAEKAGARQDRMLDLMEKNPGASGLSMGAIPNMPNEGTSTVAAANMPANATAVALREGFIKRGMAPHIADGFVLNYQDESALNSAATGDNGTAFGFAQWRGDRFDNLKAIAQKRGVDWTDHNAQLDHTWSELNGPESAAWKKIQATKNAGEAAAAIARYYERPAAQHLATREKKYLAYGAGPMGANRPAY